MEAIGYTLAGDGTLHIHVSGKNKAIRPDASSYEDVMAAVREKRWEDIADLLCPLKDIEAADDRFEVVHGVVVLTDDDGEKFDAPTVLGEEILRYAELGLDFDRLILFAKNLDLNPSRCSVQQLYGWLKETNLTLTEDGHFIAYKGLKEDWTDHQTGTFDNSVGKTVKMKRNQVDEDPNNSCSHGLHVGNFEFAHSNYGGGLSNGSRSIAVKIHPKDVVAVPNIEHEKMRVCEYFVLEECKHETPSPIYEEVDLEDPYEEECEDCYQYESDCVCD